MQGAEAFHELLAHDLAEVFMRRGTLPGLSSLFLNVETHLSQLVSVLAGAGIRAAEG
jgi:hypothetical protein